MATINKNRIRPIKQKSICSETLDASNYYNTLAWRRFRQTYYTEHPVCEECLRHHKITPADDLHHLVPFGNGVTEQERWRLFLDPNNVKALCEACHYAYHTKMKRYKMIRCDELTQKEYEEAHREI